MLGLSQPMNNRIYGIPMKQYNGMVVLSLTAFQLSQALCVGSEATVQREGVGTSSTTWN